MGVVALSIGLLGPRTRGQSLEALALDDAGAVARPSPHLRPRHVQTTTHA
jgi:hypothetical protein